MSQLRVCFCENAELHYFNDHDDIWLENAWYSREEYNLFNIERRECVRYFRELKNSGGWRDFNEDDFSGCIRGVEHLMTARNKQVKRMNRFVCIQAVLTEQTRQRIDSVYIPDAIRDSCREQSLQATILAVRRANMKHALYYDVDSILPKMPSKANTIKASQRPATATLRMAQPTGVASNRWIQLGAA